MAFSTRGWVTAAVFALVGCFSESDSDDDDDDNDATIGNSTDPTLTTTIDPSVTTSMTSVTTSMTTMSSDPTSETDPSVDSSGTTDSDTDPDTTTDPTIGGCPGEGDAVCDDGMAVAGELCFLEPESIDGGAEQIGALAIGDLNGDGMSDVAFTDGEDGYVALAADGDLQSAGTVVGMVSTWSVDIGELDTQMAVAFGAANAEVHIVRWDGAFVLDPPLGAPGEFVTARFGAFDDDNELDLLVGSEESGTLYVYTNDGNGGFDGVPETIDLASITGVADLRALRHDAFADSVAALTRDGRLVVISSNDGSVMEIDAMLTYGNPTTGRLAAGDLDADDDTDLAVGFDGRVFVFRATALGFAPSQSLGTAVTGAVTPTFADIDNDGLADVVIADALGSSIEIYLADDDGFAHSDPIQVPPQPRGVGVADFNLDCAADVVALGPAWFQVAEANP